MGRLWQRARQSTLRVTQKLTGRPFASANAQRATFSPSSSASSSAFSSLAALGTHVAEALHEGMAACLPAPITSGLRLTGRVLASLPRDGERAVALLFAELRHVLTHFPHAAQLRRCHAPNTADATAAAAAAAIGIGGGAGACSNGLGFGRRFQPPAAGAILSDSRNGGASPSSYASGHGGGGGGYDSPPGLLEITWRWLFPLDGDVLLLSLCVLVWNACMIHHLLSTPRHRPLLVHLARRLRKFCAAIDPISFLLPTDATAEDIVHGLLQLGCAAYCGRLCAEMAGWLEPHSHALDFGSASGLTLHATLGLLTWGVWSAASAACEGLVDGFAAWRWAG